MSMRIKVLLGFVTLMLLSLAGFSQANTVTAKTISATNTFYLKTHRVDSISYDTTLSSVSDVLIPSQRAIKKYVDSKKDSLQLSILGPVPTLYIDAPGKHLFDKGFKNLGNIKFATDIDSIIYANVFSSMVQMRNELKVPFSGATVAEGNSITAGVGASNPATTGYVPQVATYASATITNNAVSNSTAMDVVARQFTNALSAKVVSNLMLMYGINNLREDSDPRRQAAISNSLKVLIVNQFLDSIWAISNAKVTKTGTWSNFATANAVSKSLRKSLGNPMKSSTLGNTLSFTWYDDNLWIGTYAWATSHNLGSFNVTIDGVTYGPFTGKDGCSDFTSQIGTYDFRLPIVFGFTNLGSGAHTVTITLLENKETDFDYIGKTMTIDNCKSVIVSHITKCTPAGWLAFGQVFGSNLAVDTANANIDTVTNYFRTLGFPVATAHVEDYYNPSTSGTADGLHPGDPGYIQLAKAVEAVISIASSGTTNLSYTPSPTGGTVTSSSGTPATLPLADITNAGLLSPLDYQKLQHPLVIVNIDSVAGADTILIANGDTVKAKQIQFTSSDASVTITKNSNLGKISYDLKASGASGITTASNGLSASAGNVILGGTPLTQGTVIKGANGVPKTLSLDTLSVFQARALTLGDTSKMIFLADSSSKKVDMSSANARASGYVRVNMVTTNDALTSLNVGKVGSTFYGAPLIQMQSSDSSLSLRASRIFLDYDTTLASINSGIYIKGLSYTSTTTNRLMVIWDKISQKVLVTAIPTGGSTSSGVGIDSVITITSGTSSTVTNGYNVVRFNPASTMSTYTLTLPTTWHTSNDLLISFSPSAFSSGSVVTTLTIVNGSGQTLAQSVIPTTASYGEIIRYHLIGTIDQRTN